MTKLREMPDSYRELLALARRAADWIEGVRACGDGWSDGDTIASGLRRAASRYDRETRFSPDDRAGKDVIRDAARYQWLRAENAYAPEEHQVTGGEELDQLCDKGLDDELYAK